MRIEIVDLVQGSDEWIRARLGIPTASEFSRILTASGKRSGQSDDYAACLLSEYYSREPYAEYHGGYWTDRGHELEPYARRAYTVLTGEEVRSTGIILRHDGAGTAGASPDGLVGDGGLVEIKCPAAKNHLHAISRSALPTRYVMQVQGLLWVSGRDWVDYLSYHPEYPPLYLRVEPDPAIQRALDDEIPNFLRRLADLRRRLEEEGVFRAPERF